MLGYYLLGTGIIVAISGISMAFSKKERERIQRAVMKEEPERSTVTGSPEALRAAQKRGYILLAVRVLLLVLWLIFFGPETLAAI